MVRERFWSDNPYRLVGEGTSTDCQLLGRRARQATLAAKVGIATAVPMDDRVEADSSETLLSIVRLVTADPLLRTQYRIMWPLDADGVGVLCKGGVVIKSSLSQHALRQVLFLSAWLEFLEERQPKQLEDSLQLWHELDADDAMDDALAALLTEEDGVDRESALAIVHDAQAILEHHLLEAACNVAAGLWAQQRITDAIGVVTGVLESPLGKLSQESALAPMITIGDSLGREVRASASDVPFEYGQSVDAPADVVHLERLAEAIVGRHPNARAWKQDADFWYDMLARRIWTSALASDRRSDNRTALSLTNLALEVARDADFREHLVAQKTTIAENLAYDGIQPIGATPSMYTINGVGTMLYTTGSRFPHDPKKEFAILYFTVLFLPVFPLSRYLVQSEGGGSWRFFGQTKWSKAMWAHLIVACCLGCAAVIGIANSTPVSTTSSTTYDASSSYSPPTYVGAEPATSSRTDLSTINKTRHGASVTITANGSVLASSNVGRGQEQSSSFDAGSYSITVRTASRSGTLDANLQGGKSYRLVVSADQTVLLKDSSGQVLGSSRLRRNVASPPTVARESKPPLDFKPSDSPTPDGHREALKRELDELKLEIDQLDREAENSAATIDAERARLKSLKERIDSYILDRTSQADVDAYNALVDEYNAKRLSFNDLVREHNERVQLEKEKVARHNEIVEELNAGR